MRTGHRSLTGIVSIAYDLTRHVSAHGAFIRHPSSFPIIILRRTRTCCAYTMSIVEAHRDKQTHEKGAPVAAHGHRRGRPHPWLPKRTATTATQRNECRFGRLQFYATTFAFSLRQRHSSSAVTHKQRRRTSQRLTCCQRHRMYRRCTEDRTHAFAVIRGSSSQLHQLDTRLTSASYIDRHLPARVALAAVAVQ